MSTSLGFLKLNKNQERTYLSELAKRAKSYEIDVYTFSPADIDPKTEMVLGEVFNHETNTWDSDNFPIPEFIYDRCFYSDRQRYEKNFPIVNWLKNKPDTHFLGHGLPNKLETYHALKNHSILKFYTPETSPAKTPNNVLKHLTKQRTIILKPTNGSQGRGIIALTLKKKGIELRTQRNKKQIYKIFSNRSMFIYWLKKLLDTQSYMIQPLLQLTNHSDKPFDIRILLQKNKHGEWSEIGRGIREGLQQSIISNLHGGGVAIPYKQWIEGLSPEKEMLIEDEISTILENLPTLVEESFGPLFELGVDIGVAQDGAVWLLDVNSKPGHQVVLSTNENKADLLYEAPLHYCNYLKQNSIIRR